MAKNLKLIIVESPTKAKTIAQFLGSEYEVHSSYGHLRDLPKSKLGIDVEKNFEPQYIIPRKAQSRVTALKKTAAKAPEVILATDEDREGEAIAWHLVQALGLNDRSKSTNGDESTNQDHSDHSDKFVVSDRIRRIVFHEITQSAIEEALKNPRDIDMHLVNAQQARRVLDRLVGYKLSPFLWKKVASGLSAGRVQSAALRLIVDREEEIKAFNPEIYHTVIALLASKNSKNGIEEFEAGLYKIGEDVVQKPGIKTKEEADRIVADLKKASYQIAEIEKKEVRKNPQPPFITSTLQQAAAQRLGFSSKKTMFMAQSLYENGYITYMRTDSVNLSKEALGAARRWTGENLPKEYGMEGPRVFKTKSRLAQEAHEAIRPTNVNLDPKSFKGEKDQQKVYDLIWRRFLASQLPPAVFDATRVLIDAKAKEKSYTLNANGNILKFDGYLKMWPTKFEAKELPELREKETLDLKEVKAEEHATEPPPRYNEASLVKTLEKNDIGRPSTYAPIISVIQERNYVEKNQGRFHPTEIGTLVNKVLTEHFPEIVDIQFTARMEDELDEVAEGQAEWQNVIKEFYDPFSKHLEKKYEEVVKKEDEKTDLICEKCGKPMIIKFGRFGKFIACSGYPECKTTKNLNNSPKTIGLKCPKCQDGDVIERRVNKKGRSRGRVFWGCSRYPDCNYASWTNPLLGDKKEEEKEKEEIPTTTEGE